MILRSKKHMSLYTRVESNSLDFEIIFRNEKKDTRH